MMMLPTAYNLSHPLNPQGRFGRLSFAAWLCISNLILSIGLILAITSIIYAHTYAEPYNNILAICAILIFITIIGSTSIPTFIFIIRRLHDRNQSGWLSLLIIVPLVNLIFLIYLFCAKGTVGENNFGPARITQGWEKVLGWIYIILIPIAFVLGVIAAIAIPAYQDYVQRAQQTQQQYNHNTE